MSQSDLKNYTWSQSARSLTALLLLFVTIFSALSFFSFKFGSFGTLDFIEYWSAFNVAQHGNNPYDPPSLLSIQAPLGWTGESPLMMWNPPWLLVMMQPILCWDFQTASRLWLCLNIVSLIATIAIISRLYANSPKETALCALACCLFFPTWTALAFGQLGVLFGLLTVGLLYSLEQRKLVLAGIILAIFSVKPHLFYLVALLVFGWSIRAHWWRLFLSAGFSIVALAAITSAAFPGSLQQWTSAIRNPPPGIVELGNWRVATIVGAFREVWNQVFGIYPGWPLGIIPLICGITILIWLLRLRSNLDWLKTFPTVLCLSLFTAPIGWMFDHAAAIVVQGAIACQLARPHLSSFHRVELFLYLAAINVTGTIMWLRFAEFHDAFFWVTGALLLVWLRWQNIQRGLRL